MQIEIHLEALRSDLASVASLGDQSAAAVAERMAAALDSSFRLRMLDVVSEAARELSSQLERGRIDVRLAGGEPTLVFVEEQADAPTPPVADDALHARITLRLPESLKARVEAAANHEGLSVNTWLVQAIGRSLEGRPPRVGRHLTGFAQS